MHSLGESGEGQLRGHPANPGSPRRWPLNPVCVCANHQCQYYREVQQLRAEVRESDQVKFAVLVYTALNSHNYVKFFKLVHAATFLNVCILHRYFNQMRACCLQRLRAYVMPGHTADVSLLFYIRF